MNEEESIDTSEEHVHVQHCKRTPRQIAIETTPNSSRKSTRDHSTTLVLVFPSLTKYERPCTPCTVHCPAFGCPGTGCSVEVQSEAALVDAGAGCPVVSQAEGPVVDTRAGCPRWLGFQELL